MKKESYLFLIILVVAVMSMHCGGGGSGGGDSTAPTVLDVQPSTGPINGSTEIVIAFDESMDPGTLVLGGPLGLASDGGSWSMGVAADDTLSIGPSGLWSSGVGQALTVDGQDLAGNPMATLNLSYTVDTGVPVAVASPSGGSVLLSSDAVVLVFNESMQSMSLSISGTLAQECDGGVWSSQVSTNDTLSISPAGTWTLFSTRTLDLDATDMAGNALSTVSLSYTIGECVPFTNAVRPCPPSGGSIICEYGTQSRSCDGSGVWGSWGTCSGGIAVNPPAVCP